MRYAKTRCSCAPHRGTGWVARAFRLALPTACIWLLIASDVAHGQPLFTPPGGVAAAAQATVVRTFEMRPRTSVPYSADIRTTDSGETIAIVNGGVHLLIRGVQLPQLANVGLDTDLGTIDIKTDRAVIWSEGLDIGYDTATVQTQDVPLEIYMEGNIIFRQGEHLLLAHRMYYDVRQNVGVILDAELLTPLPETNGDLYEGVVRLKAAVLQRLSESQFLANDAIVTTSRLQEPGYHLAAGTVLFEDIQAPRIEPTTGLPLIDPATGAPDIDHRQMVTASSNRVYVEGIPVFYWPRVTTDLQRPAYFFSKVRVGNDNINGTQVMVGVDAFQALGILRPPDNTDWVFHNDYLSQRGLAGGTTYQYRDRKFPNLPGLGTGLIHAWGLKDHGLDTLGRGRERLVPEEDLRFRLSGRHRQRFGTGWQVIGEIGWVSDRTFREQFFEEEYDRGDDRYTGFTAEHVAGNQSIELHANARANNFRSETQHLPEFTHYWLGQPLLGDRVTWYERTSVGYLSYKFASTPTNDTLRSFFKLLPWETNVTGERFVTRQEIDIPFALGPVRMVPFALGELGHWGEDIGGQDRQRAYFQSGLRASMPVWAVFPNVFDPLFNLNGLAHKMVLDAEVSFADANRNIDQFPLYDPLDDNAIEQYRRMLFFTTFGGTLPGSVPRRFDARTFAVRSGMQRWVTSPALEVVDDQQAVRLAMRHRLQTKRGRPGAQHIVDWLSFDAGAVWFPDAARDNFGEDVGLVHYDARWHLGDRFTVLSDGQADLFMDGLQTISGGVLINRPIRGNAYVGFRSLNGPFEANVVTASYAYRMTPKWVSAASATVDLGNTGNIGQTFTLSRIGESLIFTAGLTVDASKRNVGARLLVEPRFLRPQITRRTGLEVPPLTTAGIE